jgi:hypothetical protein
MVTLCDICSFNGFCSMTSRFFVYPVVAQVSHTVYKSRAEQSLLCAFYIFLPLMALSWTSLFRKVSEWSRA